MNRRTAILFLSTMYPIAIPLIQAASPTGIASGRLAALPRIAFVAQERHGNPDGVVRYHSRQIVRKWGCSIQVIDPAIPAAPASVIFANPKGAILDMNLSYDARTLFFTMREGYDDNWHLYQVGIDGGGLKQITQGNYHDFSPAELPDGRLVFASSRIKSFNICAQELSTALFTARRDGSDIRQITMNTLNDMSPHVLPNGQIIYTRWEYIDRDVKWRQSLWTVNPDGTSVQLYFGNTVRDPAVMWQARPIPGRNTVIATFAPHHGWPLGAIGTVTNRFGVETERGKGYKWISREYPRIGDNAGLTEWAYRDPFPLTSNEFLVSYGGGLKSRDHRFKIYLLNDADEKKLVWEDKTVSCIYPVPLRPRKRPPVRVKPRWQDSASKGTFLLQDVYTGMGDTVKRGEIVQLRIMEQVPKFPINESSGRVYEMTPVMGRRSYYTKRCLGTVPVEEDGSAHFKVPAFRELYFQALDADGLAVQSMGSAVNLAPGEKQSCIGCHEDRQMTPLAKTPLAASRPPVEPIPYAWGNNGNIDFVKIVQPVLDRHCASCHQGRKPEGGLDLSGDKTRFFNMAYDGIYNHDLNYTVRLTGNDGQVIPPKSSFSYVSRLRTYIEGKDPKHSDIKLSKEERERFYVWIDSNSNYYGTHQRTRPGTPGGRDLWSDPWFKKNFLPVFNRHCASCHRLGGGGYPKDSHWINLTNPDHSLVLTAHLAEQAGGYGLNREKDGIHPPAFVDTRDTIYTSLLEAIREGRQQMLANPRMDMAGANPRRGRNDWGTFGGTGDPEEKASGNYWDTNLNR